MATHKKRSDAESGASSTSARTALLEERLKIHRECNMILNAANEGDIRTAMKLSDDSVSRYPDSAFLHNSRAGIYANAAARTNDPAAKVQYRKTALGCNRRSVELNPNSIAYARHLALTLFELVNDGFEGYGYNDVLDACERALHLDNPTDPVEDLFDVEGSVFTFDPASRIKDERNKLIELTEEAEKKKTRLLGPGDRKDELDQLINDDFLAQIKNEIEALERKKEEIINAKPLDDATHSLDKKKYRNIKKLVSNIDIKCRAKDYWNNTMNFEDKRELLKIGIQELKEHFDRKKLRMAIELLMEGIDFAKKEKTWKFSVCWCCGERSRDAESNMNHIMNAHLSTLPEDLQSLVPEMIPQTIVDMIEHDSWKPVDSISAAETMQNASPEDPKSIKWPYSDDCTRALLIESIRLRFESFVRAKCFAPSLLTWSLNLVMTMLSLRIPKPALEDYSLHETILSICFLEAAELKAFRDELENLVNNCALRSLYDLIFGEGKADHEISSARERIVLSADFSHLLFDERYLRGDISEPDDGTAVISSSDHGDDDAAEVPTHADTFVDWLWPIGAGIEEELETWTSTRDASRNRGMELFKILEMEFGRLQRVCKRKCQILRRAEPLLSLKEICREERKKGEKVSGFEPQSCRSLLLKLQKELEKEGDSVTESGKFELNLIRSILQKAQEDVDIQTEISERTRRELYKLDAMIMVTKAGMRRTGLELAMVSVCDDRWIMVPLLKSFMQARLLDQVEKDATEKANAATEALLAELNLDAEQNTGKSGSSRGRGQRTSKDKKKKPFYRNAMDSKATGGRKKPQYDMDQAFRIRNYNVGPAVAVPLSYEELKKQEEQAWVEAEEGHRKLVDSLEFQRKVENEAKQKRLAEQNKIAGGTSTENVVEGAPAVSSEAGEDVGSSQQQQSHSGLLPLNVTEDVPAISREDAEDVGSSEQQQSQSGPVPPNDAEDVPAISCEDTEDIGSSEEQQQQQQQQSHSGPAPLNVAEDVPAISCEDTEYIGSSKEQQQQQSHSGLVPLNVAEDVPTISGEDAEDIGSSGQQQQQQQQSQSRLVPLNVAEDVPAISFEDTEDIGSSEEKQQQSHSGPVPLNVAEDVQTISCEDTEDIGSSQQQQQSHSGLVPMDVAEVTSSEDGEDIDSSEQQEQPRQCGIITVTTAKRVPSVSSSEAAKDVGSWQSERINVKIDLCLTCLSAMFGGNCDYPEINISQSTHESKRQDEDNEKRLAEQNKSTGGADSEKHHKTGEEVDSSERRQQETQTGDVPLPSSGI